MTPPCDHARACSFVAAPAVDEARRRRHEYLTLEHLLLAPARRPARHARSSRACGADVDKLQQDLEHFLDRDARDAARRSRRTRRSRRLASSACCSAPPCTLQRRARRRSTAGTCWSRSSASRLARGLPAREAGRHAPRRAQLHLARHRQGWRGDRRRAAASAGSAHGRRRRRRRRGRRRRAKNPLEAFTTDLVAKAAAGRHRPADRPRERARAHDPGALPAPQEQPGPRRRPRRRQDRDRRGPRAARSTKGRCRRRSRTRRSTRSTWARCSPARSSAASSRSA